MKVGPIIRIFGLELTLAHLLFGLLLLISWTVLYFTLRP